MHNVPPLSLHPGTQQCLSDDIVGKLVMRQHSQDIPVYKSFACTMNKHKHTVQSPISMLFFAVARLNKTGGDNSSNSTANSQTPDIKQKYHMRKRRQRTYCVVFANLNEIVLFDVKSSIANYACINLCKSLRTRNFYFCICYKRMF